MKTGTIIPQARMQFSPHVMRGKSGAPHLTHVRDSFHSARPIDRCQTLRSSKKEGPLDPPATPPASQTQNLQRRNRLGFLEALFADARYTPGQLESSKIESGGVTLRSIGQFFMAYPLIRLAFTTLFPATRIPYLEPFHDQLGTLGMYSLGFLLAFIGNYIYVASTVRTKEIANKDRIPKPLLYKAVFNILRTHGNFLRSFLFAPASFAAGLSLINTGGWINVYVGGMACIYALHLVYAGHVAYKWGLNGIFPRKPNTVRLALQDMETSKRNLVKMVFFMFKEALIGAYMFITLDTLLRFSDLGRYLAVKLIYSPHDQGISALWLLAPLLYQIVLKNFLFKPLEAVGARVLSPFTHYAESRIRERMIARGESVDPKPGDPPKGVTRPGEED